VKRLSGTCHHDVPPTPEDGATFREQARESCGYPMGVDLFTAREQVEAGGGPEKVLDRAVQKIERGGR
jgi:hypothetical protein